MYSHINSFVQKLLDPKVRSGASIIVGHKGTVSALAVTLLKLPKSHHHFLQIDRGSVTIIQERNRNNGTIAYELFCANERPSKEDVPVVDFTTEERTRSHGEVFLVRHGQTASNISKKYQGSQDIPLSETGVVSMKTLANSFSPRYPTRILSSPLLRAKQSAQILAQAFNIKVICERQDIHEFLYGVWEGMSEEDVQKYRTAEYNQWKIAPLKTEIPQAEHINNAYNRCREVWEDYEKDIISWGGSIVSVAHDIVNRLLICNALDLPANYVWCFKQTNASVSVLAVKEMYDGRLRMLNHNRYPLVKRISDDSL